MMTAGSVVVSDGAQVIVADNAAGVYGGGLLAQSTGTHFNVTGAGTHVSFTGNKAEDRCRMRILATKQRIGASSG